MSHKSRSTTYNEVFLYKNGGDEKSLKYGTVMVDSKAIYVGEKGNWRFSWKSISNIEMDGRECLRITCDDGETRIECLENAEQNFYDFKDFLFKIWNKKQGKKEAKAAMENAPPKKRRVYGGGSRKYAKLTVSTTRYKLDSSDEEDDTKDGNEKQSSSWDAPPEPEEVPSSDEAEEEEEELGDETNLLDDENDENHTPHVQNKTKPLKGKRRLQKKSLGDNNEDSDFDEDLLLDDPGVTTPKRSNRLVSPMNDDDDDKEKQTSSAQAVEDPSTKGTRSITSFFAPKSAASSKTSIAKAPAEIVTTAKLTDESKKPSPLPTSLNVAKSPLKKREASPFPSKPFSSPTRPLKNNTTDWLSASRPSATRSPARSRFFPLSSQQDNDSDIESPSATPPRRQDYFSSSRKCPAIEEEDDDIENSPPSARKLFASTSGVDRRRRFMAVRNFRDRRLHYPSPTKRSLADTALSIHTPAKRMRIIAEHHNPYSADKRPIIPFEVAPKEERPWRGLRNLGNTCYLNSSLQMLFSVPTFVSSLTGKGKDLAKSIVSVSQEIKDTEPFRASNPKLLKSAVDAVTDKFQGYEQRDAHEFLSDLVDRVHDELEEEKKEQTKKTAVETTDETTSPLSPPKDEKKESVLVVGPPDAAPDKADDTPAAPAEEAEKHSPVETADDSPPLPTDEYFRMNVQVCLTCDSCGYARTMEEMYRHLSIDVEDENASPAQGEIATEWSVQKGLNQFFAPETREIRCEKCADGMTCTQTLRILSRPKALLLHLKRFVLVEKPIVQVSETKENADDNAEEPKRKAAVEMTIRKNKAPVVLNPTVSLGPIVESETNKENDKDGPMATFEVKSVVHHIGSTAWSGHYTCDAIRESDPKPAISPSKGPSETWVTFDDGITSVTSASRVLESEKSRRTAYMLLYTLRE